METKEELENGIILFGAQRCNKTVYYQELLKEMELPYSFQDVEENEEAAAALRDLYENRRLNFPTLTIGEKKLRNPSPYTLKKWLERMNWLN